METISELSPKKLSLNDLGVSIMLRVFENFSIEELKLLSTVCKMWYSLANSDYVWKRICEKNLPFEKKKNVSSWKKYYYQKGMFFFFSLLI